MTTNLATATGRRLLAARRRAGLTADEAARRAGLEPGVVGDLERGGAPLYIDALARLADLYGESVDALAGRRIRDAAA